MSEFLTELRERVGRHSLPGGSTVGAIHTLEWLQSNPLTFIGGARGAEAARTAREAEAARAAREAGAPGSSRSQDIVINGGVTDGGGFGIGNILVLVGLGVAGVLGARWFFNRRSRKRSR